MSKPVYRAVYGNCSGSVFVNEFKGADGKMRKGLSASFQKYYKDKDGKDAYSGSFGVNDLQKLRLCVEDVFREMVTGREALLKEPENEGD